MSANENQNENGQNPAESHTADVAYKLAHVVGVSTPEDRYHSPGSDDHRSDAALAAMGVEPDHGPGRGLIGFTLLIVALLGLVGVGTIEFFQHFATKRLRAVAAEADTRLVEMHAAAETLLTTPAALEGTAGHYRIPITDALAALGTHPELLAGHPLGVASEIAIPADAFPPPPPPPPPVFVPGEVDPITGLVMLAPGVPCIPGTGAVLPPATVDPVTGLEVTVSLPAYDPITCALIAPPTEGSGAVVPEVDSNPGVVGQ